MKNIYEFSNYKAYLLADIGARSAGGRGMKTALARACGCQPAYVTQVLSGTGNFSLEQGEAISRLLGHTDEERGYFLLLIQWERAGTLDLRRHFQSLVERDQKMKQQFSKRIPEIPSLDERFKLTYYSRWDYAAVHVLLTIEGFRSPEKIAHRLRLPLERVLEVLGFLSSCGLAKAAGDHYETGDARIHLSDDNQAITRHHTNWRLQAIAGAERAMRAPIDEHLHYSSVVSLSAEDVLKIRQVLMGAIERSKKVIKESPAETLYGFCVDLFPVG